MKLSRREKNLVIILLAVVITAAYHSFVYKPQSEKLNNLKAEKTKYEDQVEKLKATISTIPKKEYDIKILNSKIADRSIRLYPKIIQEKLITEMDKLMGSSNIKGSINFSDIENKSVLSEKDDKAESKKTDDKTAEQMKATINFKGKYEDVVSFVKAIDGYSRKVAFSTINISQSNVNEIMGNMTLEFFAVPKIGDEDKQYFSWEYNNSYGKANMFDLTSNIGVPQSIENSLMKEKSYDFLMSVRPINSDLPTVTLGKAKDNERKTYVYSDNSKEEKVELYVTEKDGKYYYKYKTSRNSYPMNYQGNGEEFVPVEGNINLKIYSTKRLSDKDESSVTIEVYNNTGKTMTIYVENDDSNKPRININGNAGSIEVKKN